MTWAGVWAFLKFLPFLWQLKKDVEGMLGDKWPDFLNDVVETQKKVEASLDPNLSADEKRRLRYEALKESASQWIRTPK